MYDFNNTLSLSELITTLITFTPSLDKDKTNDASQNNNRDHNKENSNSTQATATRIRDAGYLRLLVPEAVKAVAAAHDAGRVPIKEQTWNRDAASPRTSHRCMRPHRREWQKRRTQHTRTHTNYGDSTSVRTFHRCLKLQRREVAEFKYFCIAIHTTA